MRDQYALNGTPSTSTKWVREPQTFDTFHVDFDLFAPFSDTTASHGSTFSTFDLTNDDITLDTSHGRDRCSQQPSSFSTDGETQGRYHPTRPTAIDGSHPNESYGDRLAREILYITHTGLQDFNNWRSIHRPQSPTTKEELDHILQRYFDEDTSNHLSMTSRTNFAKYMLDFYDVANTYTAQKLQCQYCKKRFAKHFLMPIYPKLLHRTDANTYLFCWGCLQAANGRDHMIHPGPWLNTTKESEDANLAPVHDLSVVSNRPWALQSLD